jgi:hypothetical protein
MGSNDKEDVHVDVKIILKCTLEEWIGDFFTDLARDRGRLGVFCECDDERTAPSNAELPWLPQQLLTQAAHSQLAQ